jgi:hypothetical protein
VIFPFKAQRSPSLSAEPSLLSRAAYGRSALRLTAVKRRRTSGQDHRLKPRAQLLWLGWKTEERVRVAGDEQLHGLRPAVASMGMIGGSAMLARAIAVLSMSSPLSRPIIGVSLTRLQGRSLGTAILLGGCQTCGTKHMPMSPLPLGRARSG